MIMKNVKICQWKCNESVMKEMNIIIIMKIILTNINCVWK